MKKNGAYSIYIYSFQCIAYKSAVYFGSVSICIKGIKLMFCNWNKNILKSRQKFKKKCYLITLLTPASIRLKENSQNWMTTDILITPNIRDVLI